MKAGIFIPCLVILTIQGKFKVCEIHCSVDKCLHWKGVDVKLAFELLAEVSGNSV